MPTQATVDKIVNLMVRTYDLCEILLQADGASETELNEAKTEIENLKNQLAEQDAKTVEKLQPALDQATRLFELVFNATPSTEDEDSEDEEPVEIDRTPPEVVGTHPVVPVESVESPIDVTVPIVPTPTTGTNPFEPSQP